MKCNIVQITLRKKKKEKLGSKREVDVVGFPVTFSTFVPSSYDLQYVYATC